MRSSTLTRMSSTSTPSWPVGVRFGTKLKKNGKNCSSLEGFKAVTPTLCRGHLRPIGVRCPAGLTLRNVLWHRQSGESSLVRVPGMIELGEQPLPCSHYDKPLTWLQPIHSDGSSFRLSMRKCLFDDSTNSHGTVRGYLALRVFEALSPYMLPHHRRNPEKAVSNLFPSTSRPKRK